MHAQEEILCRLLRQRVQPKDNIGNTEENKVQEADPMAGFICVPLAGGS